MKEWKNGYDFWDDFSKSIKENNRFYVPERYTAVFDIIIEHNENTLLLEKGTTLFRARIHKDEKQKDSTPFKPLFMGVPPRNKMSPGRLNPLGISYLYLSREEQTCINEVKPYIGDYITIGVFKTTKLKTKILDLCSDNVFINGNPGRNEDSYIPIEATLKIATDYSRPINPNSQLDYLPLQYFSEYVKRKNYDGIQYKSSIHKDGINITLFKSSHAKCLTTKVIQVAGTSFSWEPVT